MKGGYNWQICAQEVAAISEVWKQNRIWCPYLPPPDPEELRITGTTPW